MPPKHLYPITLLLSATALLWLAAACLWAPDFSPCPFRLATGLPCPACGSTRAVAAILRGDFAEALRLNPIGYLLCAGGAVILSLLVWDGLRGDRAYARFYLRCNRLLQRPAVWIPLVGLIVANWVWNLAKGI